MARNTTLQEIVRMVREEAGHSVNAALGQNTVDAIKNKIRRQQDILWEEYAWPHLQVERDIALAAGQRYYNFPADLSPAHRIDQVVVKHVDEWRPVEFGITVAHYNTVDSELGERRDPVLAWDMHQGEQIEVWPTPATGSRLRPGPFPVQTDILRLRGTRKLLPLIADGDRADLDDRLLSLFVAAEITAKQNQGDAGAILSQAQRHLSRLKGNQSRERSFRRGTGGGVPGSHGRPRPTYGGPL